MSLIITSVFDGPITGGVPKGVELYATADIADLSIYGLGSANNGGGTDGEEFTFPADAVTAGDYIYVASEAVEFQNFFGFAPNYTSGAMGINGDDAIELFESGAVIDLFGDINVDGTGAAWEYLDSWASRNPGNTATTAFNLADWTFGGTNALDGETTNAAASTPVPLASFAGGMPPVLVSVAINEIHADPASDLTGDANGDGARDATQDEFVELVNTGTTDADLSGYTISDAVGVRHTVPDGTVLAPGEVLVIFGGGTPTGDFGGATVQTASSGALGFNNGGDTVAVADAGGATVAEVTYGGEGGNNQSLTRDPSLTGDFVEHSGAAGAEGALFSPGELLEVGTATPTITINEIHADPASDLTGDANGDGARDATQDEFVELVNTGTTDADLSGYTISDAVGVRHTVPDGTVLAPGEVLVVFGGGTPTGDFGAATVQTASSGALGLNNGGDTVTLADTTGATVAEVAYGGEGGNNQSLTRDPSLTGDFVEHTGAVGSGGALFSPGELLDSTVPPATPVFIHEIQGDQSAATQVATDDQSALAGQVVSIEAIVTADFQDGVAGSMGDLNGFYVQEEEIDYDMSDLTSEGIFVFDGNAPAVDVMVGDLVQITGTVSEFFGETQLSASSVSVVSSGNMLPAATTVSFPVADVYLDDDGDYLANLEAYEGMLINIPQDMVLTEMFNLDRFGEARVSAQRDVQFTQDNDPSVAGFDTHLQDVAKSTIVLDDGLTSQNPNPIAIIDGDNNVLDAADTFGMGDTIGDITGVVGYSFDEFRLHKGTGTYTDANPRETAPADIGGDFKVASLNVLNFFTTLDENGNTTDTGLGPRGADNQTEYDRQLEKLVNAIVAIDADVLGLVEVENDSDDAAMQAIVDAVNAELGSMVYGVVSTGLVGGDAIKNGLIYKIEDVNLVGGPAILETFDGINFLDPLDAGRPLNRPAVAQTFEDADTGETLTIAVNHLKSKGSLSGLAEDDAQGDGQGNNNATREAAADLLAAWLASDPTGQGSENVLILGDLNAYQNEDPVKALEAAGFTDLADAELGSSAYSFVFDGQIGTLDYALANDALAAKVAGVTEWHINSDEPDAFDYNLDFGRDPALFDGGTAHRNSDHDPVIVSFDFGTDDFNKIVGGPKRDFLGGGEGADMISGLGGNDIIRARGGDDMIDGGDGTDFIAAGAGNDTITAGDGPDLVYGGAGDDVFIAGKGVFDQFVGGNGFDTFIFSAEVAMDADRDKHVIQSYRTAEDVIDLGGAVIDNFEETNFQVKLNLAGGSDQISVFGVTDFNDIVFVGDPLAVA